mmetsp:Transcript_58631/g.154055  ORF Transcript_58631/g.154055 Transcript_58631/m.154055 type:complete len:227 (-) Transcript_58631:21-701(-)
MVRTLTFPPEYKQWTAMLAMKGDDEDPRDRSSRWSCGSCTNRTRVIGTCCVLDSSISGRSSCPILFFADDASMISDSIAGLQLAFDCCWAVAKVCGLGTKIGPKSKHALEATRQQVRKKMVQILRVIGRIPVLQIYANARDGGLQHEHAYRVAAAALIDQIDRALCGAEGEPHRAAVKSAIVGTCRRLGCRGYSPLEWTPEHLRDELSEDNVIEAWLLAKRSGRRG